MSVYRLILELVGKDAGATQKLRAVKKEAMGLEQAAQKLQGGLAAAAGIAGMAYMGKQALDLVGDLYMLGAQAMRTEKAFDELAKGAGGSADAILQAIKKATGGTVSEMDAMAAANRGILLGLGANAEQWGELTEVARYRARAMGLSVTQALNDITTGIGRESRMILDNLGIVLDLDAVMNDYAATLGKTAGQLDTFERKQAMITGIISETSGAAAAAGVDLGNMVSDQLDDVEAMAAAWADLKVEIGRTVAEWELGREALQGLTNILRGDAPEIFAANMAKGKDAVAELEREIEDARATLAAMEGPSGWWSPEEIAAVQKKIAALESELQRLVGATRDGLPWMSDMASQADFMAGYAQLAAGSVYNLSGAIASLRGPMSQVLSLGDQFEQMWLDIGGAINATGMEFDAIERDLGKLTGEEL
ncbi:MAG TPA: hypothetical protein VMV78_09765, partial [Thiobacillus sp.]|nr:hypothetical protein [Thiobacillus sp.]